MTNKITVRQPNEISRDSDIQSLVDDWKAHLQLQVQTGELSENTRVTYNRGWDKFWTWLKDQDVDQVDSDLIRSWISQLKSEYKPNTINAWLSGVRNFFSWSVGNRRLGIDPTSGIKTTKRNGNGKKHLRKVLSNGDVRHILDQPDRSTVQGKRDYAILCLKAYAAVRDIEIHRADLEDLQSEKGVYVLYVRGKGRMEKDEFIVIANPDLEKALLDWLSVRPAGGSPGPLFSSLSNRSKNSRLSMSYIRRMVKGYYRSAGVIDNQKTSHSMRHTAITNAIRHGAPVQKVQSMARHANVQTTMDYYHEVDRISDPGEAYIVYDGE